MSAAPEHISDAGTGDDRSDSNTPVQDLTPSEDDTDGWLVPTTPLPNPQVIAGHRRTLQVIPAASITKYPQNERF